MKLLKFSITFLASCLIPFSQVSWAAMDADQKNRFNQFVKDNFRGSYNDFYRTYGHLYDSESRGWMEAWLKNNGKSQMPKPQASIIKDKNGKETLKLIFNQDGRNLTLTFTEDNYETIDVNGQKVALGEVRNIPTVLAKLAKSDVTLEPLAKELRSQQAPPTRKSTDILTVEQFSKLSNIQKVQYLMLLRQNVEAAQRVMDEALEKSGPTAANAEGPSHMLHPLIASQIAWAKPPAKKAAKTPQAAKAAPISVKENQKCIVAGNVSVYERSNGRLSCAPFPQNPQNFGPQPTFHDRCTGRSKGRLVACNPLLYGTSDSGTPFCVDSGNQPRFTNQATADCNAKSPLRGAPDSPERLEDYKRILKSYAVLKGTNADELKDCFNEENKIATRCRGFFEGQYNQFVQFKNDAEKICSSVKLTDQFKACDELRKRALDLITFMDTLDVKPLPIVEVNLVKEGCEKSGLKYDEKTADCLCPDGKSATHLGNGKYECPKIIPVAVPVEEAKPEPVTEKKDECEKDPETGKKDYSFKCNKAGWIFAALGIGLLALLLNKKPKPTTGVVPGPIPPPTPAPPTTPTTPTTVPTMPPPTPTVPPVPQGEGGTVQQPGGGAGGVRGVN